MPSLDPSDDFSQLPTADGAGHQQPRAQPVVRRQQTRIGPRAAQPPPEEEPASGPVSEDWMELLESTHGQEEPAPTAWTTPPIPVSAPIPPRGKTIIGRKSSATEAPAASEEPIPPSSGPSANDSFSSKTGEPEQETNPGSASPSPPQRTVIGKKTATDGSIPEAPAKTPPAAKLPALKTPAGRLPPTGSKPPSSEEDTSGTPLSDSPQKSPPETTEEKADTQNQDGVSESSSSEEKKSASEPPATAPVPSGPWQLRWDRWGGKALGLSLAIHLMLMIGGGAYVMTQVMEPEVDFLPGGGSKQSAAASQALEHQIQQKKTPWLKKAMPVRKIAAVGSVSDIVLPDDVPDLTDLPQAKDLLGGKLTAGMGLAGAGGGMGSGMGLGSKSGMVFQPFSMFGMQIKAKKLALILDVSTSMAPHLPRVIAEVDKVSRGSVVVLYFGCGLEPPPPRGLDGDDVYSTSGIEFEKFWRLGGATLEETRKHRIDPKVPIPSEDIFRILSKRPQTYFIHHVGLGYSWLALLSDKVREVDGLYWFSDFEDRVDFSQLTIVRENLLRRKQRLYMHAYLRGTSYDLIRTQLVEPTKGDVKLEDQ